MIGRQRESLELLEHAHSPIEAFALVVGPVLSGRTTLLEHVRWTADRSLAPTLVTSHPSERHQALSGLALVLNALGDARLAEFGGRFMLADESNDGMLAATNDLLVLVRRLRLPPRLLLIDDLDGLDEASQIVLSFMASRLTGTGLRVLGSMTPGAALTRFDGVASVTLDPFGRSESIALAQSVKGHADPQVVELVCQQAGGSPGLIVTLFEHLSALQLAGHAALQLPMRPAPGRYRVDLDDDTALHVAQRVSSAPLTTLASMRSMAPHEQEAFDQLVADTTLETFGRYVRMSDPALRSRVYWGMPAGARRAMHERAAIAEAHEPALAAWHDSHAHKGSATPDGLLSGAIDLVVESLPDAAVELAERALATATDIRCHVGSLLRLGDELMRHGEVELCARYTTMLRAVATEPHDVLACAHLRLVVDAMTTGKSSFDEVDVYVSRYAATQPRQCAELLCTAAALLVSVNDIDGARARLDESLELWPEPTLKRHRLRFWIQQLLDALDAAGSSSRAPVPDVDASGYLAAPGLLMSAGAFMMREDHDLARRAIASVSVTIPPSEQSRSVWRRWSMIIAAENESRAGRVSEACEFIDALEAQGLQGDFRSTMLVAWRASMLGRLDEADAHLDAARELARRTPRPIALAQLSGLEGACARGDFDEAAHRFDRARRVAPGLRPGVLRTFADHAEALFLAGKTDKARQLVDEFAAAHAHSPGTWSHMALARSRMIVADGEGVLRHLDDAMAAAESAGSPFEEARTAYSAWRSLERIGQSTDARHFRRVAEQMFQDISAPGWAAAVRDSVAVAVAQPNSLHPLLATLTDDELAVLRLIARGVRNKDIAAALFVSLRTVEVRITQIYRKLDARSRSHLLALLPTVLENHQVDAH